MNISENSATSGGRRPPCQGPQGRICRGCSGWQAMLRAAAPGGPWEGLTVICPLSGTAASGRD